MKQNIKKARFANNFARKIKAAPGIIPNLDQMRKFQEEVTKRFDEELGSCNDCKDHRRPECPCCLMSEFKKEVAEEYGFNAAYMNFLENISDVDFETIFDYEFHNFYVINEIDEHERTKVAVVNNYHEIMTTFNFIKDIEVSGALITLKFKEDTEFDGNLEYDIVAFLCKVLKFPKLNTCESGMQPHNGLTVAAWGW